MRLLIVKLSSIGDVVHTLPAASLLRKALPDARITWAVERRASAILEGSPVIDELVEIDARSWRSSIDKLRTGSNGARRFDVAIDFQGLIKSGLVAFASRAGERIGFETRDLRERPSLLLLTRQIETACFAHVIDKNLALARAAAALSSDGQRDLPDSNREFPIAISRDDERFADSVIENHGRFAILNPGGGWPTKLWPAARYSELADWLWNDCGLKSLVTFGPGEEALANQVAEGARTNAARSLASTLKQFVALARRAELFVGGDTGPLHLAAASGTPIVGLYGPTSVERNGPFNPRDITVSRDLWCRADCHRRSCWHWECMDIPVSDVKQAVLKRLSMEKEYVTA